MLKRIGHPVSFAASKASQVEPNVQAPKNASGRVSMRCYEVPASKGAAAHYSLYVGLSDKRQTENESWVVTLGGKTVSLTIGKNDKIDDIKAKLEKALGTPVEAKWFPDPPGDHQRKAGFGTSERNVHGKVFNIPKRAAEAEAKSSSKASQAGGEVKPPPSPSGRVSIRCYDAPATKNAAAHHRLYVGLSNKAQRKDETWQLTLKGKTVSLTIGKNDKVDDIKAKLEKALGVRVEAHWFPDPPGDHQRRAGFDATEPNVHGKVLTIPR